MRKFRLDIISTEYGYKYTKTVYGTSEQSIRRGWIEYGLNELGTIINVTEV